MNNFALVWILFIADVYLLCDIRMACLFVFSLSFPCLLKQVGAMLKPFLPQLQTTFIKALNDPNREVRMCAATALQKLIKLHTRVDPLFTELHNGVKNTEDNTIRLAGLLTYKN